MCSVYDFDKTLTIEDTFIPFLGFMLKALNRSRARLILVVLFAFLYKLKIISNEQFKNISIKATICNVDLEKIDVYAKLFSESKIINLSSHGIYLSENKKDDAIIITGALEIYAKYFFTKYFVIGSKLYVDHNGYVKGLKFNCFGANKVTVLKFYGLRTVDTLYTDSMSDLPLMQIADKVIMVSNHQKTNMKDAIKNAKRLFCT